MTLLILGVALWWATHLFPLLARPRRDAVAARIGEGPWKGLFALVSLAALAAMVIGYQRAEIVHLWYPPLWGVHVTNLLMLIAVFLLGASHSKGNVRRFVRHPMLLSVVAWGAAHLFVRGDVAAVLLFGGMAGWAVAAIFAANARDGARVRPEPAPLRKDAILVAVSLVVFAVIAWIHLKLGVAPFPR